MGLESVANRGARALTPHSAAFLHASPPLVSERRYHRAEDGFLYIAYSAENTLGAM